MIKSMTGYGRNTATKKHTQVTVRVRSVNSRFLDLKVRGTELEPELDMKIRDRITESLTRGSIQVHIDVVQNQNSDSLVFNKSRFESIDQQLLDIQKEYGQHIALTDLVSLRDLFYETNTEYIPVADVLSVLDEALLQTNEMRTKEGEKLQNDMSERCLVLDDLLYQIESKTKNSAFERKEIYISKIQEIAGALQLDENRLYQEIAVLAERSDTTEEIVRFRSHIEQFKSFLILDEPVGKRMNFLLQEMVREVNTIGSKNVHSEVAALVIEAKSEVEKLREQIQNVL